MPDQVGRARWLALACTVLGVAVVGISAYMRLKAAGLGCADWPDCYGRVLQQSAPAHDPLVRLLHRVVATLALVSALALAWTCRGEVRLARTERIARALVVLMLVLAVVGPFSADPTLAAATLVNILGGILVVVLAWRARWATLADDETPLRRDWLLAAGMALFVAAMVAGAMIASRYAVLACPTLPACDGTAAWPGLGPWLAPVREALRPGDPAGVVLHLFHRYAALLGIAALLAVAWRRGGTGMLLLAVALVEALLGALMIGSGFGLPWAVSHALGAALLAMVMAVILARSRGSKA